MFAQADLDCDSIYASQVAWMMGVCYHTRLSLLVEIGVSLTFCLGWPRVVILQIDLCLWNSWDYNLSHGTQQEILISAGNTELTSKKQLSRFVLPWSWQTESQKIASV
jgi:hypothetical protein